MTTLPSFVELMASLGLEQPTTAASEQRLPSPRPSPTSSPHLPSSTVTVLSPPTRSRSSQSLRDSSAPVNRVARYSPYSSTPAPARRGSLSSTSSSSSSDFEASPLRSGPNSPRFASSIRKRSTNKLSVNIFGSATDLAANTPISTYVRRKTPGTSPTSPTFPRESRQYSPSSSPMPFTIPTLPPLFPHSSGSDCFPLTPEPDAELDASLHPDSARKPLADILDISSLVRRSNRRLTGVRISTPPRSADLGGRYHHQIPPIHIA